MKRGAAMGYPAARPSTGAPQSGRLFGTRIGRVLALVIVPVMAAPSDVCASDKEAGQALYERNCQACHGASGNGEGPAARSLRPRPTSFTASAYWAGTSDQAVAAAIVGGRPGTAMMAFQTFSSEQLDDLVSYLRTLSPTP